MQDGSESMYLHFLWQKEKGVDQGERSPYRKLPKFIKHDLSDM